MNKVHKTWRGIAGIIILLAILGSFTNQMLVSEIPTYTGRVLGFFSYFTEYSNILVILWFINKAFLGERIQFLNKDSVRGAITLYICIAGIVFFFVLNSAWNQHGIEKIQSYILHGFSPIAFILDWLLLSRKGRYNYKDIGRWIIFPIVYLFGALFIGNIIGSYPYPFLDLNTITVNEFLNYLVFLVIAFIGMSFIIVSVDKLLGKLSGETKRKVKFVENN